MPLFFRVLFATALLPGTVALLIPWWIAGWRSPIQPLHPGLAAAAVLMPIGFWFYASCTWKFARRGRGTPAPWDPPKKLIVEGLHRYMRNPMYVGVIAWVLGAACLWRSWPIAIYAACLALMFHARVLLYEERVLREEFGGEFEAYCAAVPRWVPRRTST